MGLYIVKAEQRLHLQHWQLLQQTLQRRMLLHGPLHRPRLRLRRQAVGRLHNIGCFFIGLYRGTASDASSWASTSSAASSAG